MPPNTLERAPFYTLTDQEWIDWLAHNQKSIGGSQIGMILGASTYGQAADVFDEVCGLVPRGASDNRNMRRGRVMEPHIADEYTAATGRRVYQSPSAFHPSLPFVRASPDRLIRAAGSGRNSVGVLEIKCHNANAFRAARMDGVDPSYYAQLQHYMWVLGKQWGAFALFNADDWALHHFDVERDDAYIQRIIETVVGFWTEHVLTRNRPVEYTTAPVGTDPLLSPRAGAQQVVINETSDPLTGAVMRLRVATEAKNLAEHGFKQAQDEVKQIMADRNLERVTTPHGRITWTESSRTTFDRAALAREYPDLDLSQYERVTATRTFRPVFD